jgi:signal transduction histidine kinase
MRLLNITNRYYIFIAFSLLLIGNAFLTYRLLNLVDQGIVKNILLEKQIIDRQIYEQKQLQNLQFKIGDEIEVEPIEKFTTVRVTMRDTVLKDSGVRTQGKYKVLSYEQKINNDGYRIHIWKRMPERRNLIIGIIMTVFLTGLVGMISFFLLNGWFAREIWKPFYNALNHLKNFDLRASEKVYFERTDIDEFKTMNKELGRLMNKVEKDYKNLKEFTENVSHETQTPLAIIHSRLDVLMQSENLTSEQHEQIRSTLSAVNRLSKMNKGLILLAKIENNQFFETTPLRLGKMINEQLGDLEMFISAKQLSLQSNIDTQSDVMANEQLAEILVRNLLSNAVRYNIPGGLIAVDYSFNKLEIKNSGNPPDLPPEQIFHRFRKGRLPESLGLGLAIVKKICDFCGCEIGYTYENKMHTFSILFPVEKVVSRHPLQYYA